MEVTNMANEKQTQLHDFMNEIPEVPEKEQKTKDDETKVIIFRKIWNLGDNQVVTFNNDENNEGFDEFLDYLAYRAATDQWYRVKISELYGIGIRKEPLFSKEDAKGVKYVRGSISHELKAPIDIDQRPFEECIRDGLLVIAMPTKNGFTAWPTRYTATHSLLKRAGVFCDAMLLSERRGKVGVVDIRKKADIFNMGRDVRDNDAVVLIRDGKIGYAGSSTYVRLCPMEGEAAFFEVLKKDHPEIKFDKGMASHEYVFGEYLLHDETMEESLRVMMDEACSSTTIKHLRAGVRYATSEVGMSAMNAHCFVDIKTSDKEKWTRITLPNDVRVEHDGKASIEMWREELEKLGTIFKECEERLEALGNIPIECVWDVVKHIRETYTFLPVKSTETVITQLKTMLPDGKGTAMDCFMALNDIVQDALQTGGMATPATYINITEQVARLMFLDYHKIDKTKECNKMK